MAKLGIQSRFVFSNESTEGKHITVKADTEEGRRSYCLSPGESLTVEFDKLCDFCVHTQEAP